MDLTVVICASDDFRLFRCIESIDDQVEIVCAITPNSEIERRLKAKGIRYALARRGSHSAVTNAGIALVRTGSFLLMDSDCTFLPGAIRRFQDGLRRSPVVKGRIRFLHGNSSWASYWISRCREFENTYQAPLYKPGLAMHRDVAAQTGGWFNEQLSSTVDADLGHRIIAAGIIPSYIDSDCILHDPVSMLHNVRSCYSYGKGDCYRHVVLGQQPDESLIRYEMSRHLEFLRRVGYAGLPLLFLNDIFYYLGYFARRETLLP